MLSAVIFSLALVVAGGFFVYTLYHRFRLLQAARPVERFDRIPERIAALLLDGFGQKKFVVDEQPAGWLHFFIFWGFLILGVQVATMFGRAYSDHFFLPGLSPDLLGGPVMLLARRDGGHRPGVCTACIISLDFFSSATLVWLPPGGGAARRTVAHGGAADSVLHHDHRGWWPRV